MTKEMYIYTSGGSRGNPGPAAIGVYITDTENNMIQEAAETIGNAAETFAEYQAVLRGLQIVHETYGEKTTQMKFTFCLTSELVYKQLNSECQIKDAGLVPHFIEIHNLRVSVVPNLVFVLIPPKKNAEAKRLVNEALDAGKQI